MKEKSHALKLRSRKLAGIFRILARQVMMTRTYFVIIWSESCGGGGDWKKEEREWKSKEGEMVTWGRILEELTREFERLQKRVSKEFYGLEKEVKVVTFTKEPEVRVMSVVGSMTGSIGTVEDSALALRRKMQNRREQTRLAHIAELRRSYVKTSEPWDSGVDLATPRL